MCQDNSEENPEFAKTLRSCIIESCDVLIEKMQVGEQKDTALIQATDAVKKMRELTEEYEQRYI
jgi:hypothetical protein